MLRFVLVLCVLAVASEARAQRQVAPYQPSRPTTSPYLYLTIPDAGVLPNYQAFVEPLQNQQQINVNQQAEIGRLRQQQQADYAPARAASTGTGSVYNNLSHYYPGGPAGGQRSGGQRSANNSRSAPIRAASPYEPARATAGMGGGFF